MEFFLVRIFLYLVRIQESTDQKKLGIWTLFTQRKYATKEVKPKNRSGGHHLVFYNHPVSYDDFSYSDSLTFENKTISLELKESLLVMRDQQSYYKNISTIASNRQGLVIRSLLQFCLFLIFSTLFSFNGLFMILSSMRV